MNYIRRIPTSEELLKEYPLNTKYCDKRLECIKEIKKILSGKSLKKIICVGPCSADREDAVIEYCSRLAVLADRYKSKLLIIPRVYTGKPRTNGEDYKGIIHSPDGPHGEENILKGIISARKMHVHIIENTGLFSADEMLYPELMAYYLDLLVYTTVGARTIENQEHKLLASGLDMPVGMKNPTNGNLDILLNAIVTGHNQHSMFFNGWEIRTEGNPYVHAILRGYTNRNGEMLSNYHVDNLYKFCNKYQLRCVKNMAIIIDCNHCNSKKNYDKQNDIAHDVLNICRQDRLLNNFIKGLMIESYIEDGRQASGEKTYGKSVTDGCLGWKKTEVLLEKIFEEL